MTLTAISNNQLDVSTNPNPFPELPKELGLQIFSYLNTMEVQKYGRVNKAWNELSQRIFLQEVVFGKSKWATYFGDIGKEPPLPTHIYQILTGSCPIVQFWSEKSNSDRTNPSPLHKRTYETDVLVLIPTSVNDQPFTLETLGKLIQKPKQGHVTQYKEGSDWGAYKDVAVKEPYWVLLNRNPTSRTSQYKRHNEFAIDLTEKTGFSYAVPKVLEAATCILMYHVHTGKPLFDKPYPYMAIRCQEFYNKEEERTLVIGNFLPGSESFAKSFIITKAGIRKSDSYCFLTEVAVVRKFQADDDAEPSCLLDEKPVEHVDEKPAEHASLLGIASSVIAASCVIFYLAKPFFKGS